MKLYLNFKMCTKFTANNNYYIIIVIVIVINILLLLLLEQKLLLPFRDSSPLSEKFWDNQENQRTLGGFNVFNFMSKIFIERGKKEKELEFNVFSTR